MAIWWGGGHPRGTEHDRAPAKTQRSRALQLQSQWQEVTERERRAWVRNQQLLEDFQRAQDTLRDLAARTAAMATIRMEYERQLEQHFPQWQQRFEEKRISVQGKEVALHFKEALRKMEEEGDREAHRRTTKGVNAPSLSPGPSLLPTTPILPHSLTVSGKGETHLHMLQKNKKVTKENSAQSYPCTPWRPSVHSSWLTGAQSSPGVSQASYIQDPRSPPDLRGLQDLARAGYPYQHPLHRLVSQPFDPCWLLPQEQPHRGPIVGYPPGWPGLCSVPRLQSPYVQGPWPGFPIVDPRDWGMALPHEPDAEGDSATTRGERERGEGPESQDSRQGQQVYKRPLRASNQSYELDIKPVRLSSGRADSSEGSSVCSEPPQGDAAGVRRRRRRRENKGGMPQSRMKREEATSQRSSAGSSVSSLTGSGVVRATDSRATFEARSQRSGILLATAPSIEQEENHSQEEESGSAGAETEGAVNQGTEDAQETQDSSQRDGGITDEEDEDGEKEGEDEKEDDEEEVEKTEAAEEREGEMIEDSDVEQEVHEGEDGSGDEGSVEGEVSSCAEDAEAERTGGVLEQAEEVVEVGKRLKLSAKEVGEEDPSSERNGNSEEEEETEGGLEEEVEESVGSDEEEEEEDRQEEEDEEEEADEQESCSQEENGEDEVEGSGSLEEGATEEEEESEEGNDAVEEDEEDDGEEVGTGGAEAAADNRKEESEGTTDSEDEIITSQVDKRNNTTRKADVGMKCKTGRGGGNMGDIEEEGEDEDAEQIAEKEYYENESNDNEKLNHGYEDDSEVGDYIEGLLAPKKDSSIHQVCVAEKKEVPDPASPTYREPKEKPTCPQRVKEQIITVQSKALWQDSDSDLGDNVPGRSDVTTPLKDVLEDFDEFYD